MKNVFLLVVFTLFTYSLSAQCTFTDPGKQADYEALVALYHATDGPNWKYNRGWVDGVTGSNYERCNVCRWEGVDCTPEGRVEKIILINNKLIGFIPPELEKLSELTWLLLNNNDATADDVNQLSGHIPPELGNMSSLINIQLFSNQLTGTIPSELGNLSQLEFMSLSNNQLTGNIPIEICNLPNLSSLTLDRNQLTGAIPPEIGNLSNLGTLSLYNNQFTGSIPPELGNLSKLWKLRFSNNQLTGTIPPELGNLSNLSWLRIFNNQLTGPIPPELGQLTRLINLYLFGNQLTGPIPPELGNLTSLYDLRLHNNQLSGTIPEELVSGLQNLHTLLLSNNQLEGCFGSFSSWCDLYFKSFIGNPGLPFNGNFDRFCQTGEGATDEDGDGYCNGEDCDDSDPTAYPGAEEQVDGVDNDCDGVLHPLETDNDNDGFSEFENDCDDTDPLINPNSLDDCDGIDNNCNGIIDEEGTNIFFEDLDGDGFGNPESTIQGCTAPEGYVLNNMDCDDTNFYINPLAVEICDGEDNNCDGRIDEDVTNTYYKDQDGDTFGDESSTIQACTLPEGYALYGTDCDDTDPNIHPNALEIADGIDNNCDGILHFTYVDDDGDGYTENEGDCNDNNPDINPLATEVCGDLMDNNCDGLTDAEDPNASGVYTLYQDADGDGYGDPNEPFYSCANIIAEGIASNSDDPDDTNPCIPDNTVAACDSDGDGVADANDVCPSVPDPAQTDTDGDGLGDACDEDDDNDGVSDTEDGCPLVPDADQTDTDSDGLGDACDEDDDNDGVLDTEDGCPLVPDADQTDTDGDGLGDACDEDDDGDGVTDNEDICPLNRDPEQTDSDSDGAGDACDDSFSIDDQAGSMIDYINTLDLNSGQGNSLLTKLQSAFEKYCDGQSSIALNLLNAFKNEVLSLEVEDMIAPDEAATLIESADALIDAISSGVAIDGCPAQNLAAPVTSSFQEISTANLRLFPNPANRQLHFTIQAQAETSAQARVYNLHGQLLLTRSLALSKGFNTDYLELNSFTDGLYLLEVRFGEERLQRRFVVQK